VWLNHSIIVRGQRKNNLFHQSPCYAVVLMPHNARKINEGGISSTALSLTDTVNKMLHRLMNATQPLSFNLFVIGCKNFI
jgi:hypothetical protein